MGWFIKHKISPINLTHSRLSEKGVDFRKRPWSIPAQARSPVAKLAFLALLYILRPSNFLFLAYIIPL